MAEKWVVALTCKLIKEGHNSDEINKAIAERKKELSKKGK